MKLTKSQLKRLIKEEFGRILEDETGSLEPSPLVDAALKMSEVPNLSAIITMFPQYTDDILKLNDVSKETEYNSVTAMVFFSAFQQLTREKKSDKIKSLIRKVSDLNSRGPTPPPRGAIGLAKNLAAELTSAGFPAKYSYIVNPSYRDYETKTPHRIEFTGKNTPDGSGFDGAQKDNETAEDLNLAADYLLGKGWEKIRLRGSLFLLVPSARVNKKHRNYVLHNLQIPKVPGWRDNKNAFKGRSFGVTTKRTMKKKGYI